MKNVNTVTVYYLELDGTVWKLPDILLFAISRLKYLVKKYVVGTWKSLWHIHCISDISVRDIEVHCIS